jgi:tetratricopeptide (TPR) repeat protein
MSENSVAVPPPKGGRGTLPDAQSAFAAAMARQDAGDVEGAIKLYRRTIELDPRDGGAYNNLANLLAAQDKLMAAVACLRRAARLAPRSSAVFANLGNYLRQLGRFEEASIALARAIELEPDSAAVLYRFGLLLDDLGDSERAIAYLDRAIEQQSDHVEMRWTRALVLLRLGDFARGFAEYEIRFRRKETRLGYFTMPPWRGETLTGRTLLVHTEQGFGDTLQFIRFMPMLARRGARVLFSCPPEMMRLMAGFPGVAQSLVHGAPMPGVVDFHVPILSLPHRLGITLDTIPRTVPYLVPPAGVAGPPVRRAPGTRLAVGIAWGGNPKHLNDANRSMSLEHFFALNELDGVELYSLQKGARAADLAALGFDAFVRNLDPGIADFADLAAAITSLDLVVSVDSAPVHLAGALGRPAFALLPAKMDWRWLRGRDDSPWYPTLRLFRQSAPGDWAGVMERARAALAEMLAATPLP